jgi:hypothetical protein
MFTTGLVVGGMIGAVLMLLIVIVSAAISEPLPDDSDIKP